MCALKKTRLLVDSSSPQFLRLTWRELQAIKELLGNGKFKTFKTYQIGQDFFGEGWFPKQPKNTSFVQWSKSLAEDLAKNHPAVTAKPMFLCVAAFGDCFNNPEGNKPIDGKVRDSDNKNATSAFFIIAWPGSPNICYYAAGDGNKEIEGHFYETNFLNAISDNERALVIKGTHHGAFNAFNADLFGQMKPRNYVVSAGRKFGHPSKCTLACRFTVPLYGLVLTIPKPQHC